MEHLRSADFVACLEFLKQIYATRHVDEFVSRVLAGLPRVVHSDFTGYNEYNPTRDRTRYIVDRPEAEPRGGLAVFNAFIHEHPITRYYRETQDGRAMKISDFLTASQFHRLGLYNEYFRHADPPMEDLMAFYFYSHREQVLAVALCRPRRSFSERDRFVTNLLRAHLRQAYLNAEAMELYGLVSRTLESARQGVMVLDSELRPRVERGAVTELLIAYFSQRAQNGDSLPRELSRWLKRELATLAVRDDLPLPSTPMVVERSDRRLLIRLIRQPEGCVLLLSEQKTCPDASLLERLGLTAKQGQVLSWLAQGKSDADIAMLIGSSRRTVEKHLEHIYVRLGVENRTAAASRALDFLSRFRC